MLKSLAALAAAVLSVALLGAAAPGPAAEYLLGDGASNVTGTTLYVDSGYHAMGM
jgi:enoyl-[acyl-carrier-protein] reductase (NADH)